MKTLNVAKIFIASPSDVTDERIALEDVVKELNITLEDAYNLKFDLVKWETHTQPSANGTDAQDIINKQLNDDYDVFIGILWSRIGTKTPRAISGTIEEYKRAYDRVKRGENVEVMFYFNDAAVQISKIDPEQLKSIQEFKDELGEVGNYYWTYSGSEDFERLARLHLTMLAKRISKSFITDVINVNQITIVEQNIPDENIYIDENHEEDGLLDIVEDIGQSSFYLFTSITNMLSTITTFGNEMTLRTDAINRIAPGDMKSMMVAVTRISVVMDNFSSVFEPEVDLFNRNLTKCMDGFSKAFVLINEYDKSISSDYELLKSFNEMMGQLNELRTMIASIHTEMASIPPIQKGLIKSTKKVNSLFSRMNGDITKTILTIEEMKKSIYE